MSGLSYPRSFAELRSSTYCATQKMTMTGHFRRAMVCLNRSGPQAGSQSPGTKTSMPNALSGSRTVHTEAVKESDRPVNAPTGLTA